MFLCSSRTSSSVLVTVALDVNQCSVMNTAMFTCNVPAVIKKCMYDENTNPIGMFTIHCHILTPSDPVCPGKRESCHLSTEFSFLLPNHIPNP